MSCTLVDLTGPSVMTLPMLLGGISEPHPVACHVHARQDLGVDSHMFERTVDAAGAIAH